MKLWILSVVFATSVISQGFALECWDCVNCNDPFDHDAHSKVECSLANVYPQPGQTTLSPGTTESVDTTTEMTTEGTTEIPTTMPPTTTPEVTSPSTSPSTPEVTSQNTPISTTGNPITPGLATTISTTETPSVPQNRRRRQANPEFRCFSANMTEGTRRGCTRWLATDVATCSALGAEGPSCDICNENGCNSAIRLGTSIFAILISLFIAMRML